MASKRRNNKRISLKKSSKASNEGKKNKHTSGAKKNDSTKFKSSSLVVVLLAVFIYFFAQDFVEASPSPDAESSTSRSTSTSASGSTTIDSDRTSHEHQRQLLTHGSIELLETLPHDEKAFTQGLTYFNGYIYEGTGMHGSSSLRKLHSNDMSQTLDARHLSHEYFGEGITHYKDRNGNDRFLQLTWQEKTAFVYDAHSMEQIDKFTYETSTGEGWGVTYDASQHEFIVSDGSDYLMIWDADTFQEKRRIIVHAYMNDSHSDTGIPVPLLNELELISISSGDDSSTKTLILANVWFQNYIVAIDPSSGAVLRLYDLSSLCPDMKPNGENVLNGISVAGGDDDDVMYVTGKLWQKVHKIRLI